MARRKLQEGQGSEAELDGDRLNQLMQSSVVSSIRKTFGNSTLLMASEDRARVLHRIPTGVFPLDYALGGGWPAGRINSVYGPTSVGKTTLLMLAAASAQGLCGRCYTPLGPPDGTCQCGDWREMIVAYIDVEGTFDSTWAKRHGVRTDRLLLSRPEYAEQALDILDALMRSASCDVVILDSIAFLAPLAELSESVAKDHMGVSPRTIGKGIRKFVSAFNTIENQHGGWKPTLFFTNQVRMKLGVMFGCFHGDTPVMFADGSQHKIKEVVSKHLVGPVLSWDGNQIVERPIVGWFDNGVLPDSERFLTFRVAGTGGRRGAQDFTCTRNHILVRASGEETPAEHVRVGDELLSWRVSQLSPTDEQLVIGSLFGDGRITPQGSFQLCNGEQPEYLQWKMSFMQAHGFVRVTSCGRSTWRTPNDFELRCLRARFYTGDGVKERGFRTIPLELLQDASLLTLAVWYCDDGNYKETHRSGSISVKRLAPGYAERVASVLSERFHGVSYSDTQQALMFSVSAFSSFSEAICAFVPGCMRRKLLPEHRERAGSGLLAAPSVWRRVPCAAKVQAVRDSSKKNRWRRRFDLQIAGNSFYLVGGDRRGVVVHNSPETQPGGKAVGFSLSTEVKLISAKYTKNDATGFPLHVDVGFRVDKNKVGLPRMEGEYRMMLSSTEGRPVGTVVNELPLMNAAQRLGLLTGHGGKWEVLGREFRVKDDVEAALLADRDFYRQLYEAVLKIGLEY